MKDGGVKAKTTWGYNINGASKYKCTFVLYYIYISIYLLGGLEHDFYFSIYWEQSSQLTFIFFRGGETTNQII